MEKFLGGGKVETVKNIAAIIGCILSVISLFTLCTKGGRAFVKSVFKKNTESIVKENEQQANDISEIKKSLAELVVGFEGLREVAIQDCRNIIKTIYYKYQEKEKIPLYERKTAVKTYEIYHDLFHENTYITLLYDEICKWEIDNTSFKDLGD